MKTATVTMRFKQAQKSLKKSLFFCNIIFCENYLFFGMFSSVLFALSQLLWVSFMFSSVLFTLSQLLWVSFMFSSVLFTLSQLLLTLLFFLLSLFLGNTIPGNTKVNCLECLVSILKTST